MGVNKVKPALQFKVRCHPAKPYVFRVTVLKTREQLDAYRKDHSCVKTPCCAYCNGYKLVNYKNGVGKVSNEIGELVFHVSSLRMGVICHEAVHAGVQFIKTCRFKIDFDVPVNRTKCNKNEELFAWVIGNIAKQVVIKTRRAMPL